VHTTPRASPAADSAAIRECAAELEAVMWRVGGAKLAAAALEVFLEKPTIRVLQQFLGDCDDAATYVSKDKLAQAEIILNLRTFFEHMKSYSRTTDDQQAVDAAIVALVATTKAGNRKGMNTAYRRVLGISTRMLRRGVALRDAMMDSEAKHYVVRTRVPYSNAMNDTAMQALKDALHSSTWSKPANDRPPGAAATVRVGVGENGECIYEKHSYRTPLYVIPPCTHLQINP